MVTGGTDRKIMIWDVETGNRLRSMSAISTVNSLNINESGMLLVSGHTDSNIRLWDLRKGSLIKAEKVHTGAITCVSFLPSGIEILTNGLDNKIHVIQTDTLKLKHTLTDPEYRTRSALCTAAIRPDGRYVMSGSSDGRVFVWNVATQLTSDVLRGHTSPVIGTAWSPSGKHVATCDQSGWIVIWK